MMMIVPLGRMPFRTIKTGFLCFDRIAIPHSITHARWLYRASAKFVLSKIP